MKDTDKDRRQILTELRRLRTQIAKLKGARDGSGQDLRGLIEDTPALICRFLPDGTLTLVNNRYCNYFNRTKKDLIGQNFFQFIPEEDRKKVREHFTSLNRENPTITYEHQVIAPDGKICWQQWTDRALLDEEGKVKEYQSLGIDITERKRAEEELRESEEKYRNLFDNAQAGMFRTRISDGKILEANRRAADILGYDSLDDFIAEYVFSKHYVDPGTRERMLHELTEKGEINNFEARFSRKDGSVIWARYSARIYPEKGYLEGLAIDITEEKETTEKLADSEEKYRLLVENANDAIFIVQDGRIEFPNRKAREIGSYIGVELDRVPFLNYVHPEDREMVMDRHARRLKGENLPDRYALRLVGKDGHELWAELSAVSIIWEGRPATLNFLRDITRQKLLEAQLLQAQKMETVGTIAGGVAHNFRNILAVISMKSQLIQMKHKDRPHLQTIADGINKYVDRGVQLVEALMQFSRRDASRKFHTLNLDEVIQETYQLISKSFDKMIDIRMDIPTSLPIRGDYSGLSQVIMNLCTNARDAMPKGGVLHIHARKEGDCALVTVSDTGHGMDKETREKCFDPFFTTKATDKGTGLGLSTSYGIVKEHGGEILVSSEVGNGTAFILSFPLVHPEEQTEKRPLPQTKNGRGERILIVDDEVEFCKVMSELLEGFGYHAAYVTSGKDGLKKYKTWQPDVLLVDRNMPEMDGISYMEQIMKHDPKAKVVIISGYDEDGPSGIDEEKRKLITGYLTKPIDMKQLTSVLTSLFGEDHLPES
ncbi:MAG: PAS domain S-box protein [Desulfobacteraceae bacterium]|jgi:PAS domain S-box-containing protein